jgi:hypothetical protein
MFVYEPIPRTGDGFRIGLEFKAADLWIGAFWKRDGIWWHLWVCLVPCFPLHLTWMTRKRLGLPGLRDPKAPCTEYEPNVRRKAMADCETDGHYLCSGCAWRKEDSP